MPDLYAGLLVLAAALLVFAWDRLTTAERIAHRRSSIWDRSPSTSRISCWRRPCWPWRSLLPVAGSGRLDRLRASGCRSWRQWPCCSAWASSGFGAATLTPNGAPFLLAQVLGGRAGPGLSGAVLPGSGLGDLPPSRPSRRHRAGVPVAVARQLLGHGPADPGGTCAPRRDDRAARGCWPTRWARSGLADQPGDAARPVRAG